MMRSKKIVVAGVAFAILVYCGAYAYFRWKAEIIHRKTWAGSRNYHSIEAGGPSGRDIFGALMVAAMTTHTNLQDEAQFEAAINAAAKASERRRERLSLVFTPCRWAESAGWYIVDWKRQE